MRIGISQMIDGRPGRGIEFAQATAAAMEERGFASFWGGDHVVFFSRYASDHRQGIGDHGFREDQGLFEPMLTLTAAALATTELRVGMSVDILPERNPVVRARDIATLDNFSHGRFDYGIGIGWAKEEYAVLGVPWERRGARCDEYIDAIRALWTEPRSSFHGEFVDFTNVVAYPKPVQQPHPPILVGGNTPAALRRAAARGDGWFGWAISLDQLDRCLSTLDGELRKSGRDRDDCALYLGWPHSATDDELADYVRQIERRGIQEAVIGLGLSGRRYIEQLDGYARLLSAWLQ